MNNQPIGIFDSGVGGLTIYLALVGILPKETFYYLADQKNCPYGLKSEKEIQALVIHNVRSLIEQKCKLIVIACNTATVSAIALLRRTFPRIPFVGVVPPVKPAAAQSKTNHFIILSTKVTQQSKDLKKLIKKYALNKTVYNLAIPGLVELIEQGSVEGPAVKKALKIALRKALEDPKIDLIATGCTHYPFVKKEIIKLFNRPIEFIEPNLSVAKQVRRLLGKDSMESLEKKEDKFYTTGEFEKFEEILTKLTGLKGINLF